MAHHYQFKRTWHAPPESISQEHFKRLWQQQRLEEIRAAIANGHWPPPASDSDEDDSDTLSSGSPSTSCNGSPRGATAGSRQREAVLHADADAEADAEFDERLQAAADKQLKVTLAQLQQEQAEQVERKREEAQALEEEFAIANRQQADIESRLDELKQSRHELVQQLKLVRLSCIWLWPGVAAASVLCQGSSPCLLHEQSRALTQLTVFTCAS